MGALATHVDDTSFEKGKGIFGRVVKASNSRFDALMSARVQSSQDPVPFDIVPFGLVETEQESGSRGVMDSAHDF